MSPLPDTLMQFRSDLEDAIGRAQANRSVRRRRLTRGSAAAALTVAVGVIAVVSALPGPGRSIVERAAAALTPPTNTIFHTKFEVRMVYRDGNYEVSRTEQWQMRMRPHAFRVIAWTSVPDGPDLRGGQVQNGRRVARFETSSALPQGADTGPHFLYDARRNTVYVLPGTPETLWSAPAFCAVEGVVSQRQRRNCSYPFFTPGPRPGTFRAFELHRLDDEPPYAYRVGSRVVSEREAWRIQRGLRSTAPLNEPESDRIQALLQQEGVVEDGRVEIRGREAIRLTWNAGRSVYLVDASTYAPIELRVTDERGTRITRWLVYESLPVNARTRRLLSVRAQHPDARVVRDRDEYTDAADRTRIR